MIRLTPIKGRERWWLPGAAAAAAWLRASHAPGSRIALRAASTPATAALIQGAWAAGVCVVPLSRRLPEVQAHALATRAGCARIFDDLPQFIGDGDPGGDDHDPAALGLLLFTSGTSGEPKAVRLSRRALLAAAGAACVRLELTRDDHWCACLPLDHIGGIAIVLRSMLAGFSLHLHEQFQVAAVRDDLDHGATGASLVPTMLHRLATTPWKAALRVLLTGGGPLDPELARRSLALGLAPCQTYGLSECASQVCTLSPSEAADGIGTAGTPVIGMEVSLTHAGAIRVRGSSLMDGYDDLPLPFDADGWFTTGDVGSFDAHGRLTIFGRHDDVIVSGGEKISPHLIEGFLERHPGIAEAGVYAEPDAEWGQRVCAVLVARHAPLTDDEVRELLRGLADFQRLKKWRWESALPRTALGKLQRHLLRLK